MTCRKFLFFASLVPLLATVFLVSSVEAATKTAARKVVPAKVVPPVKFKSDAIPFEPQPGEFVSAIVMIPGTRQILYAYQPDVIHPAASLTKLPNVMVSVTRFKSWDKVVALSSRDEVGGGRLRVRSGARMTLRDMLYSTIVGSANNTATALARLSGLTRARFLQRMNSEAKKAGATQSKFVDPSGMSPANMTTARDMALIAEAAFRQPLISRPGGTSLYTFRILNTGTNKVIRNTNHLLTDDSDVWVFAGKTGYLPESQYNFVTQLRPMSADEKPILGRDVLVVVLGAPTKEGSFQSAKRLAEWAWASHEF